MNSPGFASVPLQRFELPWRVSAITLFSLEAGWNEN
jgi:hypothetical protein